LRGRSISSSRRREPRASVVCGVFVLWLLGASVLVPGGCSLATSGLPREPIPCSIDADCVAADDDASPCTDERCVSGECQHVESGLAPDDHNDCTVDLCDGVQSIHDAAKAKGDKCGAQGTLICDGNGRCGGCKQDEECGLPNDCQTWTCDQDTSLCEPQNASPGTPSTDPTPGDCTSKVCDGNGGTTDKFEAAGTPCGADGSSVCDNMGHCNSCMSNVDCTTGDCRKCVGEGCGGDAECANGRCVDNVCCEAACDGVCQVCGAGGKCESVTGKSDADTCAGPAKACDSAGACKTMNGSPCASDGECASGACARGLCRLPVNAPCSEPVACASYLCVSSLCKACSADADCPASKCVGSSCLSFIGSPCAADSDCLNGKCRAGLCRKDLGDLCSDDTQCVSEHCSGSQCSPCVSPTDCPTQACEVIGGVGTCLLKVAAYCTDSAQCASHDCAGFPGQCK
jgi:hypothetical protein